MKKMVYFRSFKCARQLIVIRINKLLEQNQITYQKSKLQKLHNPLTMDERGLEQDGNEEHKFFLPLSRFQRLFGR